MGGQKFTDKEVLHVLNIIKAMPNFLTANTQEKLMMYVEIAKIYNCNIEHNHQKLTGSQIRNKFERMEKLYRQIKENKKSAKNTHAVKYFKILDEIFTGGLTRKKKTKEQETISDAINIKQETDPLSVYDSCLFKEEFVDEEDDEDKCVVKKSSKEETTDDDSADGMPAQQLQTAELKEAGKINSLNNDEGDKSFEEIKRSFITDLVESERLLVDSVKELDKNYMRNFKHHCKFKEALLKRDRHEIGMILEKDRKEMLKMFDAVLDALRKPNSTPDTSDDSSLPIAFMLKNKKIEEENI